MVYKIKIYLVFLLCSSFSLYSQDSTQQDINRMNLKVRKVIVTGNKHTKAEIILREMKLKEGSQFTLEKYKEDYISINRLGLFNKAEIIPLIKSDSEVVLNVDVNERWYILPLPTAGMEDGEWKKIWIGLNLRWDNFRGRNETITADIRAFYNRSVRLGYYIPWIGRNLKLFTSFGFLWGKYRNKSMELAGADNNIISYEKQSFDNTVYKAEFQLGRRFTKVLSAYSDFGYNYLSVSEYRPGRTVSAEGRDKWISAGIGVKLDSRNYNDFTTEGIYVNLLYKHQGFITDGINFGRINSEMRSFIPLYINKDYFLTLGSRFNISFVPGFQIPAYQREYLGYGDNYIRGWKKFAYEGDNVLTFYNELRIPLILPSYLKGKDLPVIKDIPVANDFVYRYGLYATLIYDTGTIWFRNESLSGKRFYSGAGMGLNFLLPFNYILRLDWVFRLAKPVVGQINFSIGAKF